MRDVKELLADLGVEVADVSVTGSGHYAILGCKNGTERKVFISSSPGDKRAMKNIQRAVALTWSKR
jgi:hypothetical protein